MFADLVESGRDAHRTGAWDQALAHYGTALTMVPAEGGERSRAELLRWIGSVHRERGNLDLADEKYNASLGVAEASGLAQQIAAALNALATVALLRGTLDTAAELYLRAREAAEQVGDDQVIALVDQNLGIIANIQGNVAIALLSYRSALERYRRLSDDASASQALNNMGMAHVDLAEWDAAEACFSEAADLAKGRGDSLMVGTVELNRAELYLKRRRYDAARESCDRSLQIFYRLRVRPSIAEAYKFYGIFYRETAQPQHADTHFALAVGLAEACQDRLLQAESQVEWALLHLEEERRQEGILYLNRALKLFRDLKACREVLDIERRLGRLQEMYLPAVKAWGAQATEAKDPYQAGHAERVAAYASLLARETGVTGWDLTWLRIGAFLHDIGNTAVSEELLSKTDALTPEQEELIRVHTIMGEQMITQLDFPEEVRPVVRSHHERWDGNGYPDKLRGERIPFGARIVSVADVYDMLTSPRSFRPAFSPAEALRLMEQDAERVFDPALFGIFREMLKRGALEEPKPR